MKLNPTPKQPLEKRPLNRRRPFIPLALAPFQRELRTPVRKPYFFFYEKKKSGVSKRKMARKSGRGYFLLINMKNKGKQLRFDRWKKTWFSVSGKLEKIAFKGESDFRFPEEVANLVISKYSRKGDLVLDPFCGFGTTLVAAKKLGRKAVGFEIDKKRAHFASGRKAGRIINDSIENIGKYTLPRVDLVFTSPPYLSMRHPKDPEGKHYVEDIYRIFVKIKPCMKKGAYVIIEIANLAREKEFRPQAWTVGLRLSKLFKLEGEIIRCNNGSIEAGGNNDHSHVLIFKNK
ncbi:MAG: class I SAM-dependent methyltransferase [Candidatus Micrarchaeota archaeon]|nr:class I SAM-dependent methyltransferase [Candidatus Micrarchaeota archaeon]